MNKIKKNFILILTALLITFSAVMLFKVHSAKQELAALHQYEQLLQEEIDELSEQQAQGKE